MASPKEIELKRLLIGDGAADKLIAALGPVASEHRQVNHVFDTVDHGLSRERYAVRLRFEDERPILTIKGPSRAIGAHTSARAEAEAQIETLTANAILEGRRDAVAVLGERVSASTFCELFAGIERARAGQPLHRLGSFENLRRRVYVRVGPDLPLTVEIDRTEFAHGRVDDEIEIELPREELASTVEAWLEQRAVAAGVHLRSSTAKIARFYQTLGKGPA
jgi:uncharacterized protein YjbK